jgi:hypothetical protein
LGKLSSFDIFENITHTRNLTSVTAASKPPCHRHDTVMFIL